jgi:transcriptional regulator with XRE-family HTH domain
MKTTVIETFAAAVRRTRVGQSLSQEALASRAGVDRTYVSGIERGQRNPSLKTAERIALALGVNLHDLLRDDSIDGPAGNQVARRTEGG